MEDEKIMELLFQRSDRALLQIKQQYGKILDIMTFHIVGNREDTEECINDLLFAVWNSIPPNRPSRFRAYLMKTARNLAIKKYHFNRAEKRNTHYKISLDELTELFDDKSNRKTKGNQYRTVMESSENVQMELEVKELASIINNWLLELSKEKRGIFVSRYWYGDSVEEIAELFDISKSKVKVVLHRLRKELKKSWKKKDTCE